MYAPAYGDGEGFLPLQALLELFGVGDSEQNSVSDP